MAKYFMCAAGDALKKVGACAAQLSLSLELVVVGAGVQVFKARAKGDFHAACEALVGGVVG